jgi:hypothetical protein
VERRVIREPECHEPIDFSRIPTLAALVRNDDFCQSGGSLFARGKIILFDQIINVSLYQAMPNEILYGSQNR